ncbi:IS110 family transposase [bacterium]|jgi:transposase|nr:IS110 family transposase [bacterium]MDB4728563.1 IS110 family transposase [Saprospiraceae bacterium]MDF1863617.1 IS110 family transposase [Saprospiraceae bacterium]
MHSFTHVYGIDVSKDNLDVLQLSNDASSKEKTQVKNRLKKIESWVKTLCAHSSFCVVEATGTYSSTLIYLLDKYKITVAVVSPFKSKSFMDALGISSKTDDQAAYCLALMGLRLHLKPYQMPSIDRQKRKQVQNAHHAMMKQQRMLKNQLHALDQLPFVETTARNAYEQILQSVELQIQQLEEQLLELDEDEEYQRIKSFVCSVTGIGQRTAHAMMLASNCFENFETADELSKFFGLTPNSHYSGSSIRKKGRITKMGAHYVRALLYMCSRSAIRYNHACKELYQRLRAKGKSHKVAAVAVMHKLVKQVFACVKKQCDFDNQYYLKFKIN